MSDDFRNGNPSDVNPPPSWAVRSVDVPPPTHRLPKKNRKVPGWLIPAAGVLLLLGGIGAASFYFGRQSAEQSGPTTTASIQAMSTIDGASVDPTASTLPEPTSTSALSTSATDDDSTSTSDTTATTNAPTTTLAPTTTESPTTASSTPSANVTDSGIFSQGDTRRAVFKGGIVYLGGEVPSQQVADLIASRVAAVVGPDNVVVEYTINPEAPVPDSAPLYVADLVLFARGTAEISPRFEPLLDLGTQLFSVNPDVTIDVIAHTDSESSAAFNLLLSQERADAVKNYWVEAGVDPSRITATGKGEAEPIATNATEEGRQTNRRAEFIVSGIIG